MYLTKEKDVVAFYRGGIGPGDEMEGADINKGSILSLT
jgi:hypothetical protein